MTPTAIVPEVKADKAAQAALFSKLNAAGVKLTPSPIKTPSCSVAGQAVDNGTRPAASRSGLGATNDPAKAMVDPKTKQPVSNGRRDIWVTYTALTTALNTSFMASQLALFAGVGFRLLALGGALESPKTALSFFDRKQPHAAAKA